MPYLSISLIAQFSTPPAEIMSALSKDNKMTTSESRHLTLAESMERIEKEIILSAIHEHNSNLRATAKDLDIHRVTLYKKLEKYNLSRENF